VDHLGSGTVTGVPTPFPGSATVYGGLLLKFSPDGAFQWGSRITSPNGVDMRSLTGDGTTLYAAIEATGDVTYEPPIPAISTSPDPGADRDVGVFSIDASDGFLGWFRRLKSDAGDDDASEILLHKDTIYVGGRMPGAIAYPGCDAAAEPNGTGYVIGLDTKGDPISCAVAHSAATADWVHALASRGDRFLYGGTGGDAAGLVTSAGTLTSPSPAAGWMIEPGAAWGGIMLGGSSRISTIALDSKGNVFTGGEFTTGFTAGEIAFSPLAAGQNDGFVIKWSNADPPAPLWGLRLASPSSGAPWDNLVYEIAVVPATDDVIVTGTCWDTVRDHAGNELFDCGSTFVASYIAKFAR
jgi:hypothetical protein